jgi:hypothetical protein
MRFLLLLLVLAGTSSVVAAQAPIDPARCSVVPADADNGFILCPDSPVPIAESVYTVEVLDTYGIPVYHATVTIQFSDGIRLCTTAEQSWLTDVAGRCTIRLRGGGCLSDTPGAAIVQADGITIRTYPNVKSPDFDGSGPDGTVDLADLVRYRTNDPCHDYNNDGVFNVLDLDIMLRSFWPQHFCTLRP